MLPNGHGMNDAKLNSAVGITGVISETPYYSSGSPIGLRPPLVVNVRLLP
jgi:hypothetical protein